MAHSGNGLEQVEEDLRETRAQLDETLTELEHKLTPSYAVERTKQFVNREAHHAGDVVRRYPYATAAASLAAGMLLRRMARRRRAHQPAAQLQALLAQAASKARPTTSVLGGEAYGLYRDLGELAHAVQAKLRERAGELDLGNAASHAAHSMRHTLHEHTGDLRHLGQQLGRRASELSHIDTQTLRRGIEELEQRPLVLGGAMLLLGALAGRWLARR